MPKSTYYDNVTLNAGLRNTPYTSPVSVYIALFTIAPGVGGGGTEVTGGSYARQLVTWTAPSSGSVSNVADVVFPVASADWGVVVAFAIFDNAVSGNMLYFNNLGAARTVLTNDQVKFPAGQLIVTEA
jgi:hypothetical protein